MAVKKQACTGAYTDLSELVSLRFKARLKLTSKRRSLSVLAGPYQASFRGRGIDFEEVRAYQPGDDVRSIDWRVTARTTEAHTKLFREEKERPVLVVVDQRAGNFFGSKSCFKSVLAAHAAGLIGWSALKNNDRVGGLVLTNTDLKEIRPKRSKSGMLQLLHEIHDANNELKAASMGFDQSYTLNRTLQELRRLVKPGSAIFIISDFFDFDDDSTKHCYHLARHNEVTGLRVFDAMEKQLPPAGSYPITNGLQRGLLNSYDQKLRKHYEILFDQQQQQLKHNLSKSGVPLIELETGCEPVTELMRYYASTRAR